MNRENSLREREMALESLKSLLVMWSELAEAATDLQTEVARERMRDTAVEVEEELQEIHLSKQEIHADPVLAQLLGEYYKYKEGQGK